jgi:predicted N-acyltransferase
MTLLRFIWWVVNNKGFSNYDKYLSLNNKKREQLWEEFVRKTKI